MISLSAHMSVSTYIYQAPSPMPARRPWSRTAAPGTRSHKHALTHSRTHARTQACTHARTHARTHTHTHTHNVRVARERVLAHGARPGGGRQVGIVCTSVSVCLRLCVRFLEFASCYFYQGTPSKVRWALCVCACVCVRVCVCARRAGLAVQSLAVRPGGR